MTLTEVQKHKAFILMNHIGGSFAIAIADAWLCADYKNRETIETAFCDLMMEYHHMASGKVRKGQRTLRDDQ